MENKDYGNILCEAVDTIITQRLQGLSYDQTILCTIVDDSRREQGIYIATNDSARFEVVSDQTNYRNGNNVYVLIPKGDWNETKTITGKKNIKDSEMSYIYKNPFDYLVDVTNNLIENYTLNPAGLIANGEEEICEIWQKTFSEGEAGYTRLGLNAQFRSWLNPFYAEDDTTPRKIIQGSYGLKLTITTVSDNITNGSKEATYELYIDAEDMNGNPYDFNTYFQQEKVFDISNLGKITFIKLEFYQKSGTFVDVEGKAISPTDFLGNPTADNLFVKDAYICLGYDVRDFENDDVILYTTNNTTYIATAEDKEKSVHLRWIHDFGNNTEGKSGLCVVEDSDLEDLGADIKWYQYEFGQQSADKYSGVYWKYTNENANNLFEYSFIPNFNKAEEKIKAIVFYNNKYIPSNVIVFSNEKEVPNQATIDAVSAIGINCEDGTYGNYRIYNLGNSLLNSKEGLIERNFQVTFGGSVLTEAEKIEWIIPAESSMIIIDNAKPEEDGFYHIIKEITDGEVSKEEAQQKYRIRNYYSQSYNRNTITCKVTKDGVEYSGSKELTFGPAGTTGTDVTFVLDFDNGVTALTKGNTDAITITARLYDYENKPVPLEGYTINWKLVNESTQIEIVNTTTTQPSTEIQLINDPVLSRNFNILQATLKNFGDYDLIAYLPLPIRADTSYNYIEGATSIIYNSQGYLDDYYKNPYAIYQNGLKLENVDWNINSGNSEESNFTPRLNDNNVLIPSSIYVSETNKQVCVYCKSEDTDEILWSQPLLIIQNRYPAKMINEWNGELSLGGTDGNTIMSARIVAGKKNTDNTFSGVMMGDWSSTDAESNITTYTGIYGFNKGAASFGFRDDGTAFIGKAGKGRIEFDGDSGIIKSAGETGMTINLADGKIQSQNFELKVGTADNDNSIIITSNNNSKPLKIGSKFSVDWDGFVTASGFNLIGTKNNYTITIDSNADWENGYPLKIGNNFKVRWDGTLIATNGQFEGEITATSGTIGGCKIEDGNLQVDAANITGKLTADQINLTGAITWNDLSDSVQNDINDAYNMAENAEELAGEASDTVSGWTYEGSTYIDGAMIMTGTVMASSLQGGEVLLLDEDEEYVGGLILTDSSSADYAVEFYSNEALRISADGGNLYLSSDQRAGYSALNFEGYWIYCDGHFVPATGANWTLGDSNRAWDEVYALNYNDVSDRKKKNSIEYNMEKYEDLFFKLKPTQFKFNDGLGNRYHTGFISQDVGDAIIESGLSTQDFAAFVKSPKENLTLDANDEDCNYYLRYSEFIALNTHMIQKLYKRIDDLESEISKFKELK